METMGNHEEWTIHWVHPTRRVQPDNSKPHISKHPGDVWRGRKEQFPQWSERVSAYCISMCGLVTCYVYCTCYLSANKNLLGQCWENLSKHVKPLAITIRMIKQFWGWEPWSHDSYHETPGWIFHGIWPQHFGESWVPELTKSKLPKWTNNTSNIVAYVHSMRKDFIVSLPWLHLENAPMSM